MTSLRLNRYTEKTWRLLVIGDLMLDEYIWGVAERISPEAPVPVVRAERRTYAPGGAANVVANIQSLGGQAVVFGVVGDDAAGQQLLQELRARGADVAGVVIDAKRCTTLKTRIMAQRQQIARVDHEQKAPVGEPTVRELLRRVGPALKTSQGVVLSDYGKGVLRRTLVTHVIAKAARQNRPTLAGPKPDSLSRFDGATFLSFNRSEAAQAVHARSLDRENVEEAGRQLLRELKVSALAITLGADGVALFERVKGERKRAKSGRPTEVGRRQAKSPDLFLRHIPAQAVEVFDVAGAGDTFLAATALAVAAGAGFREAVEFGNLAAAAAVRKVGVVAVSLRDIEQLLP